MLPGLNILSQLKTEFMASCIASLSIRNCDYIVSFIFFESKL